MPHRAYWAPIKFIHTTQLLPSMHNKSIVIHHTCTLSEKGATHRMILLSFTKVLLIYISIVKPPSEFSKNVGDDSIRQKKQRLGENPISVCLGNESSPLSILSLKGGHFESRRTSLIWSRHELDFRQRTVFDLTPKYGQKMHIRGLTRFQP